MSFLDRFGQSAPAQRHLWSNIGRIAVSEAASESLRGVYSSAMAVVTAMTRQLLEECAEQDAMLAATTSMLDELIGPQRPRNRHVQGKKKRSVEFSMGSDETPKPQGMRVALPQEQPASPSTSIPGFMPSPSKTARDKPAAKKSLLASIFGEKSPVKAAEDLQTSEEITGDADRSVLSHVCRSFSLLSLSLSLLSPSLSLSLSPSLSLSLSPSLLFPFNLELLQKLLFVAEQMHVLHCVLCLQARRSACHQRRCVCFGGLGRVFAALPLAAV